eukprot:GILK01001373.1.p1 GENE.GILK01001373.1~~GILK01001373.1.p1  ORF type:complete len:493 (+),score=55.90 GILK01001373.1:103-1479(+)
MDPNVKRPRTEPHVPSKVLFIRNVPDETTEHELSAFCAPFGVVNQILVIHSKNQAFVEFQDVAHAINCLNYYTESPPMIHGQPIYFAFSGRQEVTKQEDSQQPNDILLVSVLNLVYPVTVDVLHQIFSRYGVIQKIVTFSKPNSGFQALVQMGDVASAIQAKMGLEGQNIYSGCNTLKIQFSALKSLSIKYDNEKSRDYTRVVPGGAVVGGIPQQSVLGGPMAHGMMGGMGMAMPMQTMFGVQHGMGGMAGAMQKMTTPVLLISGLNAEKTLPDHLFVLFGVYGNVERVKILYNKRDTAMVEFQDFQQANTAKMYLHSVPLHGSVLQVNHSKHSHVSLPKPGTEESGSGLTKDYSASAAHRFKQPGSRNFANITAPAATLHLSNLHDSITEDGVRSFISQFAMPESVKMIGGDKKMALVKFDNVGTAVDVLVEAHNQVVDGRNVRVSFSKSNISNAGH